eukprot:3917740-Pleurochrysis_carterae.AAC.1
MPNAYINSTRWALVDIRLSHFPNCAQRHAQQHHYAPSRPLAAQPTAAAVPPLPCALCCSRGRSE